MKIYVDEKPKNPKGCLFSRFNCEYGWICRISDMPCRFTEDCSFLLEDEREDGENDG